MSKAYEGYTGGIDGPDPFAQDEGEALVIAEIREMDKARRAYERITKPEPKLEEHQRGCSDSRGAHLSGVAGACTCRPASAPPMETVERWGLLPSTLEPAYMTGARPEGTEIFIRSTGETVRRVGQVWRVVDRSSRK